eukprot:m.303927 g.303927  ORF g.303927 m.303927 type:complete len:173 (+) comp27311_c2_seq3:99-617(+)
MSTSMGSLSQPPGALIAYKGWTGGVQNASAAGRIAASTPLERKAPDTTSPTRSDTLNPKSVTGVERQQVLCDGTLGSERNWRWVMRKVVWWAWWRTGRLCHPVGEAVGVEVGGEAVGAAKHSSVSGFSTHTTPVLAWVFTGVGVAVGVRMRSERWARCHMDFGGFCFRFPRL